MRLSMFSPTTPHTPGTNGGSMGELTFPNVNSPYVGASDFVNSPHTPNKRRGDLEGI